MISMNDAAYSALKCRACAANNLVKNGNLQTAFRIAPAMSAKVRDSVAHAACPESGTTAPALVPIWWRRCPHPRWQIGMPRFMISSCRMTRKGGKPFGT